MRYSYQREVVLNVLRATKIHPTVDWIHREVLKIIPNVSPATVYRNLNQLVESGEILEIRSGASARYDGDTKPHEHLHCIVCDQIFDAKLLDNQFLEKTKIDAFSPIGYYLEIKGVCQECQQKTKGDKSC